MAVTYAEAVTAAQSGKRVSHPGLNRGWCIVWRDKQVMYVNALDEYSKPMVCKVDDNEKRRTDWEPIT